MPITIHILSDSLGETADAVARAAAAQFPRGTFRIERLPKVSSAEEIRELVGQHCGPHCIFFFTLAEQSLREELQTCVGEHRGNAIDILWPAVGVLEDVSGIHPRGLVGVTRLPDEAYFERIEALEFTIKHDDGRNFQELRDADIVLIGVSRTSKTPLAAYLASKGFFVANVPLVRGSEPPRELFEIDPRTIFGLISDPAVLARIRSKRMAEFGTYVPHYADLEDVIADLEESRKVMRRIGCIVLRTDNRAIEEIAQEIIRYLRGKLETKD